MFNQNILSIDLSNSDRNGFDDYRVSLDYTAEYTKRKKRYKKLKKEKQASSDQTNSFDLTNLKLTHQNLFGKTSAKK